MSVPFHLGMPVRDVDEAVEFYHGVLGFPIGRRSARSCVFEFFGNQFVVHQVDGYEGDAAGHNPVDRHDVPVPHFGAVLGVAAWQDLAARLAGKVEWIIEPTKRFVGTSGEQHTMFLRDPSGNALEFKAFADPAAAFAPW